MISETTLREYEATGTVEMRLLVDEVRRLREILQMLHRRAQNFCTAVDLLME